MQKQITSYSLAIALFILASNAFADNVKILSAEFNNKGQNRWSVAVTLQHDDTGWQHYADNWQVVDEHGKVLGDRVLFHPHVNEQPFTRSLSSVKIPENTSVVYITAHDKKHGWTKNRLPVDLSKARMGRLKAVAE